METLRVTYYNIEGEASEAIVIAESADDAIAQIEDYGKGAKVTAVGPAAEVLDDDIDVNEGGEPDLDLAETREALDIAHAGQRDDLPF